MHEKSMAPQGVTATDRSSAIRWRIVALLMAISFLCLFNRISISVAGAERLMQEYEITEVQMGMVYSSYLLVYTLFMLPGGWLIDRYGTKAALAAMGIGAGCCVILTGMVGILAAPALVLYSLLVIRGMTGMFSVPMFPAAARTIAIWLPPENRSLANGLVTAAALLGVAGTYYIFGAMMEQLDWPMAFIVSGLVTLGVTAVWIGYARSRPGDHAGVSAQELLLIHRNSTEPLQVASSAPWHALLLNRSLMLLTLSYAMAGYFQYVFFHWSQYYFKEVLKLTVDQSRFYATLPNLAMAAGMFAGGWIADDLCRRLGPQRGRALVCVTGLLAGALFLGLGVMATDKNWIVLWFSCAMGAVGMTEGPFWVTAVELGGKQGGASAAIFNTGGNLGGMLAPVVTPWLSTYFGWHGAVSAAGLFCVVGGVLWIFIRPGAPEISVSH